MPSAFVTGVSGQDGSYLSEQLLAAGWSVHGLVRPEDAIANDELRMLCPAVQLHEGDLADSDRLAGLVRELRPDEIYHLGGISSVAQSWNIPLATAQVTGTSCIPLLEAAWVLSQQGHPVRFLQALSAEIFGYPRSWPQNETTPINPTNPYGAAKAFAAHLVRIYRARGLFAVGAILFNHESARRPEIFVTRKITRTVARIASGEDVTLQLGNLDVRRDWGWAPDYTRAMSLALRAEQPNDYVIGTGVSHTVREFVQIAFKSAGIDDWKKHVSVDETLLRPSDAPELVADASRAENVLGWRPSLSFDDLVGELVAADLMLCKSDGDS